mmetsp:Transcript_16332/g.63733  ORF Transcript_16332/g.63733 Transcript_16332/m.63733 type:complete len:202 (-) Transcript_16332:919-1524(-)
MAEVLPLSYVCLGDGPGHGGQARLDGVGEGVVGNVVLHQQRLHLGLLLALLPQLLHIVAHRIARGARPVVDGDHYQLVQQQCGLPRADSDLRQPPVHRQEEHRRGLVAVATRHRTAARCRAPRRQEGAAAGLPLAADNAHHLGGAENCGLLHEARRLCALLELLFVQLLFTLLAHGVLVVEHVRGWRPPLALREDPNRHNV